MQWKKIAVCGTPLAGKTTLLYQFAQHTNSKHIQTSQQRWEKKTRLKVPTNEGCIVFSTLTGLFNPERRNLVSELMVGISVVIYVSSTVPPQQSEEMYFRLYTEEATRKRVSWTEIPWIFVLNKVDLGDYNPLLLHIPVQFHDDIIHCSATQGIGIDQLWQRIRAVVSRTT